MEVAVDPGVQEGLTGSCIYVNDYAIERFQIIANVLSKSTVLSLYESIISRSFDLVEPFARDLERLYVRLQGEFEISERHLALERVLPPCPVALRIRSLGGTVTT